MDEINLQAGVAKALDALFADRLALLCGAGLSMAAPSSLPSAAALAWKAKQKYDATYGPDRDPLPELIDHLAREVADSDPRFEPVQPGELPDISVEVSVLTPEREIASVDEIDIGRHGLIIEQGSHRGLLLPQVPTQHEWNRETFVAQTCLKAGLPADAWRRGARMFVFEAQVFGEEDEGFIRG